mmetsp:Transcript_34344/g.102027  ORF Transcript_34344/g.102027 Transcript_34344/m.102027 type:complete len:200 (+) Transcript_34344:57-656(+)
MAESAVDLGADMIRPPRRPPPSRPRSTDVGPATAARRLGRPPVLREGDLLLCQAPPAQAGNSKAVRSRARVASTPAGRPGVARSAAVGAHSTFRHSSVNWSVAPAGMPQAGKPPAPYPSSAGISSLRSSPTFMPRQPWSQPVITPPTPAWYVKGFWPGSLVLQNFLPDSLTTPVACTVAVEPFLISAPLPPFRISIVVL